MTSGISQFGPILASARERRGMSLADLAGATYVSRGWINNGEAGRRWPSREWVEQAERILQSGDDLLSEWERGERVRVSEDELRKLLKRSERESKLLLAVQPDAVDLDRLNESVADLAVAYLANRTRPMLEQMLEQGMALRQELSRRRELGAPLPRSRSGNANHPNSAHSVTRPALLPRS